MTDRPLFELDTDGKHMLAHDHLQWVVQRRSGKPRLRESGTVDEGYQAFAFIGRKKNSLWRIFRERGILLTEEAIAKMDALPETFLAWIVQHDAELAKRHPAIRFEQVAKPKLGVAERDPDRAA